MTRRRSATIGRISAALAAAALAAAVIAAPPAGAQTAPACNSALGTIPKDKISFQLWSFVLPIFGSIALPPEYGGGTYPPNTPPNTPAQSQAAIKNVFAYMNAQGYHSFENFNLGNLNGMFGWSDAEYRQVFESYGIHMVAEHSVVDPATWDQRLDQAQRLGLKYVGSGAWPVGTSMDTVEGALHMASVLNDLGRKARARELWVYGHNHDQEFRTKLLYDVDGDGVKESVPAIEVVMANTDPSLVTFEIDVHWALAGLGYDKQPEFIKWLRKYSKHISQLHMKGTNPVTGLDTDLGGPDDYTDWKSILAAAADVDYYHWETEVTPDPFAGATTAFKLLDCIQFGKLRDETGGIGGTVPATLALTLGTPASFGAFTPGIVKDYTTSSTATVISTAGDASLSVADPSPTAPGHLVNGTFSLPQPLQAGIAGSFAPVSGTPAALKTWAAPTSNEAVTVNFKQSIGAADALRTGAYSKILTFTLSTTTP